MKAVKIFKVLFKTDKTVFPLKKENMRYQINYPKNDKKPEKLKEEVLTNDEGTKERAS